MSSTFNQSNLTRMKHLFLYALCVLCVACSTSEDGMDEPVMAYSPIYLSDEEARKITFDPEHKLAQSGKIYEYQGYLLVSEAGAGVHIFNNQDPKNPRRLNFINIPGNQDMELKNNTLFVDNARDLVAIDISDIQNPKVKQRVENVFPSVKYPPYENVKFECVDESKGFVIGWELKEVVNPKCSR